VLLELLKHAKAHMTAPATTALPMTRVGLAKKGAVAGVAAGPGAISSGAEG